MDAPQATSKRPARGCRYQAAFAGACSLLMASVAWMASRDRKRERALYRRQIELERTAAAATASEMRFRALLEAAPDAMITVAVDGRISIVNSETERLFGYAREELIGQPIEALLPEALRDVHAGHRDHFRAQPRRRPMGAGLDLVARRRDGSEFPTEISLSPLDTEEGLAVIVVIRDITDRRKAEAERAALLREQAARAEAEAANRAKDEFVAIVSHELRTPLNAILGWSVLLQSAPSPDVTDRALHAIERNARVQRQVIDDLLDVSAITAGKVALDLQEVDLEAVIAAAEESIRPVAVGKNIQLDIEVVPALPRLRGDARRLQQVCWNLLSNAVKFTPEGGRVRLRASQSDSTLEVRVEDTGIGIDAAFLPNVFDRFRQRDSSPARTHGGLGLGLAIVRELVELHGGTVAAESPGEGRGSRFKFTLPLVGPSDGRPGADGRFAEAQASPGKAPAHRLRGLRALVVDDDPDTLRLLDAILTGAGLDVTVKESADEALRDLPKQAPDVLISDIGMPGLDGYRFITAVRELGLSLPAIALTAYGRPQDKERALAAGYHAHVAKPVLPEDLLGVIAHTTGRPEPSREG